jgi:hypothetical protein
MDNLPTNEVDVIMIERISVTDAIRGATAIVMLMACITVIGLTVGLHSTPLAVLAVAGLGWFLSPIFKFLLALVLRLDFSERAE